MPSSHLLPLGVALMLISPIPVHAGLVVYYPLDEVSGNVAVDQATADGAQDATATVVASNWQPSGGVVGGALQFSPTGQTDVDEALIYNGTILSGLPLTFSLWIKTTDATGRNHAALYLGDASFDRYYAVGTDTTNRSQLVGRNTTANFATPGPTINDGSWHHVAAVFTATNDRSLYIDGKLVGSSTTNVPAVTLTRFGVGALTRADANKTDAFSGTLDEIGLFDTAQSGAEIALLNAFPRYDNVPLSDPDYAAALNIFNTQSGAVITGTWTWSYSSGLSGAMGTTGLDGENPYVVLDASGNGLVAIPEPGVLGLGIFGSLLLLRRRRETARV